MCSVEVEIVCNQQGPDYFNGYGCFYVRLYWTGCGFQANTLEEYVLLSALLHIFVGLKRTTDQKLSSVLMSGPLNVAIACLMFFQFRFADTKQYFLSPPWKNPCFPEVILQSSVFSRFLCLPLVCAVSVLYTLCLWWLKLSSQWKNTQLGRRCCHIMFLFGL